MCLQLSLPDLQLRYAGRFPILHEKTTFPGSSYAGKGGFHSYLQGQCTLVNHSLQRLRNGNAAVGVGQTTLHICREGLTHGGIRR